MKVRGLMSLLGLRRDDEVVIQSGNIMAKEAINIGIQPFPTPNTTVYGDEELSLAAASSLAGTTVQFLVEIANSRRLIARWAVPGDDSTLKFKRADVEALRAARSSVASTRVETGPPASKQPTRLGEKNMLPSPFSIPEASAPVPPEGTDETPVRDSPFGVRKGPVTPPVTTEETVMYEGRSRR